MFFFPSELLINHDKLPPRNKTNYHTSKCRVWTTAAWHLLQIWTNQLKLICLFPPAKVQTQSAFHTQWTRGEGVLWIVYSRPFISNCHMSYVKNTSINELQTITSHLIHGHWSHQDTFQLHDFSTSMDEASSRASAVTCPEESLKDDDGGNNQKR